MDFAANRKVALSVLVATLALLATSCAYSGGAGNVASSPGLTDTAWQIEAVGDSAVANASSAALRFGKDGQVSGSTGCNNLTGKATIDGTGLTFSPLATTRRACEPELMEQEKRVLDALQAVKRFALDGGERLTLQDSEGKALMRLARAR